MNRDLSQFLGQCSGRDADEEPGFTVVTVEANEPRPVGKGPRPYERLTSSSV